MKKILVCILMIASTLTIAAQSRSMDLNGKVVNKNSNKPLAGATVSLILEKDTTKGYHDVTNKSGSFSINGVPFGNYSLQVTYIGFDTLKKELKVTPKLSSDLGNLFMNQSSFLSKEVDVVARVAVGQVKEDTTEFNADAFKTRPDAAAEDVIKKMPGVQVETDGTVKAHGEDVKKVLVDGKPFFGDDPSLALKNLPADAIDKIQIYDKMSDQSEFSGFDDGNSQKTMNIITKKSKRNGSFGKITVGGGWDDKYTASGNLNIFKDDMRLSIIGMSNNINQQNFSIQDVLGFMGSSGSQMGRMMGRMGGPPRGGQGQRQPDARPQQGASPMDYFVGQMDGITKTHAFGVNYSDLWADNVEVTGSYFVNYVENNNDQSVYRNFMNSTDSLKFYNQIGSNFTKNFNHRVNFQLKYVIDSNNLIFWKPSLNYQTGGTNYDLESSYLADTGKPLSSSNNTSTQNQSGVNFSNEILYRHRFDPEGRTLTFDLTNTINDKSAASNLYAINQYYSNSLLRIDTLNQLGNSPSNGYSINLNTTYTEPLNRNSQLQLSYIFNYQRSLADKRTYNLNLFTNIYDILDTLLSNKFDNDYITQKGGLAYRYRNDFLNLNAQLLYQRADLKSNQDFPVDFDSKYTFDNILPALQVNIKFSQTSNLRFNYRTSTSAPSITQLQNVVNNSNPLQLSTGNPNLKQSYSHSLMARFSEISPSMTNVFMSFLALNFRNDYISTSTFYSSRDTVIDNINVPAGAQLSKPVNLDGYWSVMGFVNYGFPLDFAGLNLNLSLGGSYVKTPGYINFQKNISNSYNLNPQINISSNISENLDFNIFTRANFNKTTNSIRSSLDNNYNSFLTGLNFNWIFWEGFFIQSDVSNQFYTGLASSSASNYTLLNLSLGKKFLENNAAELKLTVFDLLQQNKSYQTNVTDSYIEYSQSSVLSRYITLTFTYNLKSSFDRGSERRPPDREPFH